MWKSVTKCHNVHQCDKWLNVQTLRHNVQVTIGANRWASKWPGNPIPGQMGKAKWEESRQGEHRVSLYYLGWSTDLYSKLDAYSAIWSKRSFSHCNASKQIENAKWLILILRILKKICFVWLVAVVWRLAFDRITFCGPWFMTKTSKSKLLGRSTFQHRGQYNYN